jgi:hypothetical protein
MASLRDFCLQLACPQIEFIQPQSKAEITPKEWNDCRFVQNGWANPKGVSWFADKLCHPFGIIFCNWHVHKLNLSNPEAKQK